jgi:hypothetical protein
MPAEANTQIIKIIGGSEGSVDTLGRGIERPLPQERVPLQRVGLQDSKVGSGTMRTLTEEDIRTRAYKLWKAAGEHNTKMDAFWYQAEKELLGDRASENSAPNVARRRAIRRRRNIVPMVAR